MSPVLQAHALSSPARLRDFSVTLTQGETVGLLGINGAGKSTALQALAGALPNTRGELRIMGQPLSRHHRARNQLGWLPQHPPLYPDLSVGENLALFSALRMPHGQAPEHLARMLRRFTLEELQDRLVHRLSGGERMRLALACTLVHEPRILLLDEPSAGLDPLQAERLRDHLRRECADRTVLIASHLLPDIETLCDRVLLMHKGQIVADESLDDLDRQVRLGLLHPPAEHDLVAIPGIARIIAGQAGDYLIELTPDAPQDLAERIAAHAWGLHRWEPRSSNLLTRFRALSSGESA